MTAAGVDKLEGGGGSPAGTATLDTGDDVAEPAVVESVECPVVVAIDVDDITSARVSPI